METLRGDKDRFDALISVLNVGFERGGVVTRLEKRGERFVEAPYEIYAPRVLAGLAGLKDTLEDRALPLFMLRKRRSEPAARLRLAAPNVVVMIVQGVRGMGLFTSASGR